MCILWWKKKTWPDADFAQIKKRSRLLVIDDQEFPYLTLFKRDGYAMDKWDDLENLNDLEAGKFDVILLDIQGVGQIYSPQQQGLGIIRHLKSHNPAQVIVAYSNADWSLKYQEFFDMADASLSKNQDYFEFRTAIDKLLKARFSLEFYETKVKNIVATDPQHAEEITAVAKKALLTGNTHALQQTLARLDDSATANLIFKVIQTGTAVLTCIKTF